MTHEMSETVKAIGEGGVVLIVRAERADDRMMRGIEAVSGAGVKAVEITFSVPGAVCVIERMAQQFGDRIILGAGTILNPSDAAAAVNAGAQYVVAPNTNPEVIGISKRLGIAVMPGAFTPTEVVSAWAAGADAIKLFPASVGGPEYVRAIRAPLPHIPLMAAGGVDLDTAGAFIEAGAFALGVGSNLFKKELLAKEDFDGLAALARRYVETVKAARGS